MTEQEEYLEYEMFEKFGEIELAEPNGNSGQWYIDNSGTCPAITGNVRPTITPIYYTVKGKVKCKIISTSVELFKEAFDTVEAIALTDNKHMENIDKYYEEEHGKIFLYKIGADDDSILGISCYSIDYNKVFDYTWINNRTKLDPVITTAVSYFHKKLQELEGAD